MDWMLDPACGDGAFLSLHSPSTGVEHDPKAAAAAAQRTKSRIHVGDFFEWASRTRERFDCAAGNPPFIRYQHFKGETRTRALAVCHTLGVEFSALSASWAPFLAVTASLLMPGGRMAFVVPAEIGHAPYAAPLIEFLSRSFRHVQLVAIREKLFPELSQDVWLLFADGYGGKTDRISLTVRDRFQKISRPPTADCTVSLNEWRLHSHRLRPFLLPQTLLRLYDELSRSPSVFRLGNRARVGIGYVTGANEFFHLRPSSAVSLGIPDAFLKPSVRNGKMLPTRAVSRSDVTAWMERDEPCLLLRLTRNDQLPRSVVRYLDSDAGRSARVAYKCRSREPWYVVPDVFVPDGFLTYMSGRGPALVANQAGCVCTNSLHAVRVRNGYNFSELQKAWQHPLSRLSVEIEGHPLGGGMLKLEPGEAKQVLLPARNVPLSTTDVQTIQDGTAHLQKWRHYV
jgi:hypothetical protein